MKTTNENSEQDQPRWLTEILNRSWEAELLISGGAIISLLQISDFLIEQMFRMFEVNSLASVLLFPAVAIRLLFVNFSVHILARSVWLSFIFLQKLYPGGIRIERLNLAEPFNSKLRAFDLPTRINEFDKYCNLLFSWSIACVLLCIGLASAFGFASLPILITQKFFPDSLTTKPFRYYFISPSLYLSVYMFFCSTFSFMGFSGERNGWQGFIIRYTDFGIPWRWDFCGALLFN